jgi:diaminopimelate decarboxylase/aspartate kinase
MEEEDPLHHDTAEAERSPRDWIVLKFGGTSVATPERWETIARILREALAGGSRPLVVCSALSQVSNQLDALLGTALEGKNPSDGVRELCDRHEDLAAGLGIALPRAVRTELESLEERLIGISMIGEASARLRAEVLGAGELLSTWIGARWLSDQGLPTGWLDARELLQALPEPDNEHLQYLSATCDHTHDEALRARLDALPEPVLLTQGFLAGAPDGAMALLGRGGSDTSATCLAAKIGAHHTEIWTDVPGLFTADPRRVPDAQKLQRVGYDEASELTTRGAKVLHPRSLAPAREARIPIHIRDTGHPAEAGTIIDDARSPSSPSVIAISSRTGMTVVSMDVEGTWQQVGVIADLSGCFARRGLSIDSIASSQTRVTISLDPAAHPLDDDTLEALLADLEEHCTPTLIRPAASISVIGSHLRCVLSELPGLFRVLGEYEAHLISHAAHDHSLTFVVDDDGLDEIVRELHRELLQVRQAPGR